MKTWPKAGNSVDFESLTAPLAQWLRTHAQGVIEKYDGLPLGEIESAGCLQPADALTQESLDYNRTHQGRDAFDTVIGLAVQLGIEQGRRLSARNR
jgi:hypothetical protein